MQTQTYDPLDLDGCELDREIVKDGLRIQCYTADDSDGCQLIVFRSATRLSDDDWFDRVDALGYAVHRQPCYHEYDCCGQVYSGGLKIHDSKTASIYYRRNV